MATSLTSGEAMRKLRVTPRGTPAATKPMKAGTAEHEQKGVTTPSPSRRPPSRARVRSTLMKLRSTVTMKMIPVSNRAILVVSYTKNSTESPAFECRSTPAMSPSSQVHNARLA